MKRVDNISGEIPEVDYPVIEGIDIFFDKSGQGVWKEANSKHGIFANGTHGQRPYDLSP